RPLRPLSGPCPYTTLFRPRGSSEARKEMAWQFVFHPRELHARGSLLCPFGGSPTCLPAAAVVEGRAYRDCEARCRGRGLVAPRQAPKSTRLNSSHASISHA